MSLKPHNTWYCSTCDFYIFNSKSKCHKCLASKPINPNNPNNPNNATSYDPEFNRQVCDYFIQKSRNEKTTCSRCKREGRIYNYEKLKSNHNCWKYS